MPEEVHTEKFKTLLCVKFSQLIDSRKRIELIDSSVLLYGTCIFYRSFWFAYTIFFYHDKILNNINNSLKKDF